MVSKFCPNIRSAGYITMRYRLVKKRAVALENLSFQKSSISRSIVMRYSKHKSTGQMLGWWLLVSRQNARMLGYSTHPMTQGGNNFQLGCHVVSLE